MLLDGLGTDVVPLCRGDAKSADEVRRVGVDPGKVVTAISASAHGICIAVAVYVPIIHRPGTVLIHGVVAHLERQGVDGGILIIAVFAAAFYGEDQIVVHVAIGWRLRILVHGSIRMGTVHGIVNVVRLGIRAVAKKGIGQCVFAGLHCVGSALG
jgi:hypothetical protein